MEGNVKCIQMKQREGKRLPYLIHIKIHMRNFKQKNSSTLLHLIIGHKSNAILQKCLLNKFKGQASHVQSSVLPHEKSLEIMYVIIVPTFSKF